MGNKCCKKRENKDTLKSNDKTDLDRLTVDKSNFIKFERDKKFKEYYLIGQSMGSGHYGEVRKCKH